MSFFDLWFQKNFKAFWFCFKSVFIDWSNSPCFELILFFFRFSQKGSIVANAAVEFSRNLNMKLRNSMEKESEALYEIKEWQTPSQTQGKCCQI